MINFLSFRVLVFLLTIIFLPFDAMTEKSESKFSYCEKENISVKDEFICSQDQVHKSMLENPMMFILFYLFAILLVAFFFQLSQRKVKKKKKRNDSS